MTTEVIYARVPKALKEAADGYAAGQGRTLTGAVVDLLDRGLTAVSDERSMVDLERNLSQVRVERDQAVAESQRAKAELAALTTFSQRAARRVGSCPNQACGQGITGYDLLSLGQCTHCGQTLTSLIAPTSVAPTLDQRELMILVGALGALLGIAYLAAK
ncbi:MAG: hypothetical protein ACRDZR_01330 [Acidimicrobiales bacterium]